MTEIIDYCPGCETGCDNDDAHIDDDGNYFPECAWSDYRDADLTDLTCGVCYGTADPDWIASLTQDPQDPQDPQDHHWLHPLRLRPPPPLIRSIAAVIPPPPITPLTLLNTDTLSQFCEGNTE
jgi:hypothetical protein